MARKHVIPVVFAILFAVAMVYTAGVLNPGVQWTHGRSEEGGFTYSLPGTPDRRVDEGVLGTEYTYTGREGEVEYRVGCTRFRPNVDADLSLGKLKESFMASVGAVKVEKEATRSRPLKQGGPLAGMHLQVHLPDQRIAETEFYVREGNPARAYHATVVYPATHQPRSQLFFAAFRLDDETRD